MNYLGHLYFSGNDTALMQANLFGDFVKGSKLDHYPEIIQKGIHLHRSIDHYIDHHPAVTELLKTLRQDLPKVAGIAVDIYFDHLLALNWKHYHPQSLNAYLNAVYNSFDLSDDHYSNDYRQFLRSMINYNWMSHYPTIDAVDRMSRNISLKLSFPNSLANGKAIFLKYEEQITATFHEYMKAAQKHFLVENHRILP